MQTTITDKTVLVTGANRGLGRALVDELLSRGAKRVYAASRSGAVASGERVLPVTLDVTDEAQIQRAAEQVESLGILVNNAGVSVADELNGCSAFEHHLAVNLFGTLDVTRAFLPALTPELRAQGVSVYAILPGPIDTEMVRDLEIAKTSPEDVARATLDGLEHGEGEIFPDAMSQLLAGAWRGGVAKKFERQNAALLPANAIAA
jgi:NAD(P)-dependent dehydrogenase (short-subunit alcohol dehydrogenase family)